MNIPEVLTGACWLLVFRINQHNGKIRALLDTNMIIEEKNQSEYRRVYVFELL